MRWLKRIAIGLMAVVVLAVLTGSGYELWMRRQAARAHPAPGKLVDVGGRRMQLDCRGSGSPTVVFENGLDMNGSLAWSVVHDPVARTTRACAYSRSGTMWSDPRHGPHDAEAIAADLHLMLERAGERPPFVLVAHSIGGPYTMAYTRLYGAEVTGLVFVDASHPDQEERTQAALPAEGRAHLQAVEKKAVFLLGLADALTWTGAPRLLVAVMSQDDSGDHMPPDALAAVVAYIPQSLHAFAQEADAEKATFAEGGKLRRLGDRPLIVLTANAADLGPDEQMMGISQAESERRRAVWLTLHNEEASWSTRSRHWLIGDSHHYMQFDRPDVVIRAVEQVVEAVRRGTAPDPEGAKGLARVTDVSEPNQPQR